MNKFVFGALIGISRINAFEDMCELSADGECISPTIGRNQINRRATLPPSDSRSLYMSLSSYEQDNAKNLVEMEIKSQLDENGNPKKYKAMVSTSTSEFSIMTTDCPISMC